VPLTKRGREQALAAGEMLAGRQFELVLSSPLSRALETCRLAGFGAQLQVRHDLREWDYGAYEGLTTAEVRDEHPGWTIWTGPVPGGETIEEVSARADRIIDEARAVDGDVALFSHGHLLRVLAARWVGLEPAGGAVLALDPATISVLGHEHERSVVREWNAACGG
jgi:broad specificity phosphatase PhoE